MVVCNKQKCTGCGACISICPPKCITWSEDAIGTKLPRIDETKCIECGICKKVCHVNARDVDAFFPQVAYAAYSSDYAMRRKSASGGIGAAIYTYALNYEYHIMGTCMNIHEGVDYREVNQYKDIYWAQNSKYVYSSMSSCFGFYERVIRNSGKAIFIGLPCQIMALKKYLEIKKLNDDFLIYVEIICHGVPNWKMLREHINYIENKKKKKVDSLFFRGPNGQFDMRMYSRGKLIYKKPMHWNDEYYRAFSVGLIFRENCYSCRYAKSERIADITIGDYSGLGDIEPWEQEKEQISVILCNNKKGNHFVKQLIKEGYIFAEERSVREPMEAKGNPQLRHPSSKHLQRNFFVEVYSALGDFEKAVQCSLEEELNDYYRKRKILIIKKYIHDYLPIKCQKYIKNLLHRLNII